jgi:type IV pilus assembly protein PilV
MKIFHVNTHNNRQILDQARGGFTLIELVVAILIFALGIIGVAKMQSESVKGNSYAMQLTRANNIAQDMSEYLKVLPFTSDSLGGGSIPLAGEVTRVASDVTTAGITYERGWIINQSESDDNLREIAVQIWWQNREHSVSFTFCKGNRTGL